MTGNMWVNAGVLCIVLVIWFVTYLLIPKRKSNVEYLTIEIKKSNGDQWSACCNEMKTCSMGNSRDEVLDLIIRNIKHNLKANERQNDIAVKQ